MHREDADPCFSKKKRRELSRKRMESKVFGAPLIVFGKEAGRQRVPVPRSHGDKEAIVINIQKFTIRKEKKVKERKTINLFKMCICILL